MKSGLGAAAVFVARNRFAVLDKHYNQIQIRNLQNEITKKLPSPCPVTINIFYAGTGRVLCQSEDKVGGHICFSDAVHVPKLNVALHYGVFYQF